MIMMLVIRHNLIPGQPVSELPLLRHVRLAEKIQRPVDRRQADGGVPFLDLLVKFFRADVTPALEKRFQDDLALFRVFHVVLYDMRPQRFFFLIHGLFLHEEGYRSTFSLPHVTTPR
jgi:hypothetical protein